MAILCGIDEAGKGPLIGPLVICAFCIPEEKEEELKKMGVKDSKLLTPLQRRKLAEQLRSFKHKMIVLSPQEIDEAILEDNGLNLNWLEALKAVELIDELKPDSAVMDCPSPNIKAYKAYIVERLTHTTDLLCAHHADADHPVVGAASILAKEKREEEVRKLKQKYGDFGSGYMADPKTKMFLQENWDKYPEIFRKSWEPYKKIAKEKGQSKLGEY